MDDGGVMAIGYTGNMWRREERYLTGRGSEKKGFRMRNRWKFRT